MGGIERRAFPKQTSHVTGSKLTLVRVRVRVRVPVCGWRSTCVRETFRSKGFILVLLKHLQGVERFAGNVPGEDFIMPLSLFKRSLPRAWTARNRL